MQRFRLKKKTRFTFIALSSNSPLYGESDATALLEFLRPRLAEIKGNTPPSLKGTVIVYPWEWQGPEDFYLPEKVLGADSWNAVCMYICKVYGDFKYKKKNVHTYHAITADGLAALFQITARV